MKLEEGSGWGLPPDGARTTELDPMMKTRTPNNANNTFLSMNSPPPKHGILGTYHAPLLGAINIRGNQKRASCLLFPEGMINSIMVS
jgi:hypothetical protein